MLNKPLFITGSSLYTLALVVASLITLHQIPELGSNFDDKIYHFVAYFILAVLWVSYSKSLQVFYAIGITFLCLLFFGIGLELLQHQINSNRTFDPYDLLANCLGVVFGTLIAARIEIFKLK